LKLTPDQIRAARACGCVLTPATEHQVGRLSMQRRVFTADGTPVLVARDGFIETHGTLAALIKQHLPRMAEDRDVEKGAAVLNVEAGTVQDNAVPPLPVGGEVPTPPVVVPAPAEAEVAPVERKARRGVAARPRKPRTQPVGSAQAAAEPSQGMAEAESAKEISAEPADVSDVPSFVEATLDSGLEVIPTGRRKAGLSASPRWKIAGKLRRGRPT
jgi:hypothetical protein